MQNDSVLIGNIWQKGNGTAFKSIDPVYGTVLWQGNGASSEQIDSAIKKARSAFKDWSLRSFNERTVIIKNFKQILESEKSNFGKIISQENGKVYWEALSEVDSMINKVDISIAAYKERTGEHEYLINSIPLIVRHKPHGVIAVIGPYNFPAHLPNGQIIPALLSGNVIVFKPSEYAPLIATQMMKYWIEAGLPENVINLLNGDAEVAKALISNPLVNGILFTGSYATGKQIHQALAGQPERILALEMGGNNPMIVSEIEDIDAAVLTTIQSSYATSGQRCTCTRRLIVVDDKNTNLYLNRLTAGIGKISVAEYDASPQPFMSSIIRPEIAEKLLAEQEKLISNGAHAILPMRLLKKNTGLLSPGILDVTSQKNREDKEIFGPLIQLIRVKNFDEAIQEANNTAYGLTAGLISKSIQQFHTFYTSVRAGVVNWNSPTTGASALAPFGGVGHSGNYRPGAFYTADSCAYPVSTMQNDKLKLPAQMPFGLEAIFSE